MAAAQSKAAGASPALQAPVSHFDEGQIVMARRLGQSVAKTAELVGCSREEVLSTFQKFPGDAQPVSRRLGRGRPSPGAGTHKKAHRSLLRSGPVLTSVHRRHRLQWARERQGWSLEQWKQVAWSDGSCFLLDNVDGRACVRRVTGDEMAGCAVGRRREDRVMLWAVFCWETLGPAVDVDAALSRSTYLSLVADHVHPFMAAVFPGGGAFFQHDSVACHAAKSVQDWFREHDGEFKVLSCPADSPDLNPARNLWDVLEKQLRFMEEPPRSLEDLRDLLLTSWCQIPQDTFRGLVESMPRRVRAVLAARGGPTQY